VSDGDGAGANGWWVVLRGCVKSENERDRTGREVMVNNQGGGVLIDSGFTRILFLVLCSSTRSGCNS
jgi:hypothetical protein